jgi:hypothetical protein
MTQPSLYDGPPGDVPYRKGSRTSRQAAERLSQRPSLRATKLTKLLALYLVAGERGWTDSEVEARTGWPRQSICSLRNGLVKRTWVQPKVVGGVKDKRRGPYTDWQQVWVVTSRGREAGR